MAANFHQLFASAEPEGVPQLVDQLLEATVDSGASDLHVLPIPEGADVRWRIDGVLQSVGIIKRELANNVVVRLKVLANLLTYQTQTPQEGRLRSENLGKQIRISTFPTVHGEKLVARLFDCGIVANAGVDNLGLPESVGATLRDALRSRTGAVLFVGPAGSGKTTSAYACLREIVNTTKEERSVVTLEDPVEVLVPGVSQSEAAPALGFDLATGLRSLVRQDPEVILLGEVRDDETAKVALQAAMTGQLLITTFHANSCSAALERLLDMHAPSYLIRSAVRMVIAQRLVRLLCQCAVEEPSIPDRRFGERRISKARKPVGCDSCQHTGYHGRRVVANVLDMRCAVVEAALQSDFGRNTLRGMSQVIGQPTLQERALDMVEAGETSIAEVIRVFGGDE